MSSSPPLPVRHRLRCCSEAWPSLDRSRGNELATLLCDDCIQKTQNETSQANITTSHRDRMHPADLPKRPDLTPLATKIPIDLRLPREVIRQPLYGQQVHYCNSCERNFSNSPTR